MSLHHWTSRVALAASLLALTTASWAETVKGQITKIDAIKKIVTINHGGVSSLDMPAMAMGFALSNPNQLQGLSEGDVVLFTPERVSGRIQLVELKKAP